MAAVLGEALAFFGTTLMRTLRFDAHGLDDILGLVHEGRAVVFVAWHGGDLIALSSFSRMFPGARGAIIVEDTLAGHVLRHAAARLHVNGTALSLDPGSTRSARGVVAFAKLVRGGHLGLLAVDGPSGPARVVKPGAAFIALRADAVIIPCATAARPALRLPRWDSHLVPLPFARTTAVFGDAIDTRSDHRSATVEGLTAAISRGLAEVDRRALLLLAAPPS